MYIAGSKRDATTASIIDKDKNDDMIVMTKVGDLQKKGSSLTYIKDHVWDLNGVKITILTRIYLELY